MQLFLHQTHHTVGDFESIFQDLKQDLLNLSEDVSIHIYPELYLSGYPLQDLVIQKTFIESYLSHFERLGEFLKDQPPQGKETVALVGGLHYSFDKGEFPSRIMNVIYEISLGKAPRRIYTKALLPNYDIFDEKKYFHPRYQPVVYSFAGLKIGPMICEDMWFTGLHEYDPIMALYEKCLEEKIHLDLLVNLSASPYFLGKHKFRLERAKELCAPFMAPLVYINRVGGEDEIQFDGSSFVHDGHSLLHQCCSFKKDVASLPLPSFRGTPKDFDLKKAQNTWETIFRPALNFETSPPTLAPLSEKDCELVIETLRLGLKDYSRKSGFENFLVAVSGGIDSALVLALLKMIVEDSEKIEAIYMPGHYSSPLSRSLVQKLCHNLRIKLISFPIKFFHNTIKQGFQEHFKKRVAGVADENLQSRLRGMLLYTRSNQTHAIVINTSNKSELAMGYSTLYGDSVGGISLLGDLYKTEVYQLSKFLNKNGPEMIPKEIITRAPSAELRVNQTDQETLPPYERLDVILEGLLSYRYSPKELVQSGFVAAEVQKIYRLYRKGEYKRTQFCPIIKLKTKSFGFGHRMPITSQI